MSTADEHLPGSGMGIPGRGTRKGGTMTGGKAGMAAAGWGRPCGTACGRGAGRLCARGCGSG